MNFFERDAKISIRCDILLVIYMKDLQNMEMFCYSVLCCVRSRLFSGSSIHTNPDKSFGLDSFFAEHTKISQSFSAAFNVFHRDSE
jgi:hypothetical protein